MKNQHGETITSKRERRYEIEYDARSTGRWLAIGEPHKEEHDACVAAEAAAADQLDRGVPCWRWRVVRVTSIRTVVTRLNL